jgi:hypothetical protein
MDLLLHRFDPRERWLTALLRKARTAWRRRLVVARMRCELDRRLLEDIGVEPPMRDGFVDYLLWLNAR